MHALPQTAVFLSLHARTRANTHTRICVLQQCCRAMHAPASPQPPPVPQTLMERPLWVRHVLAWGRGEVRKPWVQASRSVLENYTVGTQVSAENSHAKRPVQVERGSNIAAGLESREELP